MKEKAKPTPWRLQYQWKSLLDYDKYSIRSRKDPYSTNWFNGATYYQDPEHAKKRLHKQFIEPYFDAIAGGRNWRIFNKKTQESFTVIIEAKSIILI